MHSARTFTLLAVFSCLIASCSSAPKSQPATGAQSTAGPAPASSSVGSYTSSNAGFETVSYWIEGPEGLILIDTQFLLSEGIQALETAERATGKKVKLAIVLHANPDKFNGTLTYRERGIPVVTSSQVRKLIPAVHKLRSGWFYERFKPDYPNRLPLPDSFGSKTRELSAGGVTVKAHVLGAGASDAHVVVEHQGEVFVGDLVTTGKHSWLELGKLDLWLNRLAEIRALSPVRVHPGRGTSGGPELLDAQEKYLRQVLDIARAESPTLPIDDERVERAQEKVYALYPDYGYKLFVDKGMARVLERVARQEAAALRAAPRNRPTQKK